jgi:hypothetical protein
MTRHTTAPKRVKERPALSVLRLTENIGYRITADENIVQQGDYREIIDPLRHPRRIARILRDFHFGESEIPEVAYWLAGINHRSDERTTDFITGNILSHDEFEDRFAMKVNFRWVGHA